MMPEQPESAVPPERARDITLLRNTLSMLCNFIWTKRLRSGEHLWSIPVDKVRDFDMILSDAIDELEWRRSLAVGGGAVTPSAVTPVRCERCGTTANSVNGVLCGSCWTQAYRASAAPVGASLHDLIEKLDVALKALVEGDNGYERPSRDFSQRQYHECSRLVHALREALASSPTLSADFNDTASVKTDVRDPLTAACLDCGKPYEDFPMDVILPRPQWLEIHPDESGLLCASCIVARAAKVPGSTCCHLIIEIAPREALASSPTPPSTAQPTPKETP